MGAIALRLSRAGPPRPDVVEEMLGAASHRGSTRRVETLGRLAAGVANDPGWLTATVARHERRLAVFCGTLDNVDDLRAALRREGGREPEDRTPAATVLATVDRWGDDGVRRLRGSFAGAVADDREVLCFRDQFGARPLFHHDGREGFYAATEVKQVLAGAPVEPEPDLDHLHGVVFGGLSHRTAYRGVERIPKRSLVTAGPEPGLDVRPYWDPSSVVETADLGPEEAVEGTREALERAVRRVLTGRDVILLSGGLDSPALAAFAVRGADGQRPVQALTAVYPDHASVDERAWTQEAADALGMRLHQFVPEASSLDDVERWVDLLDGPVDTLSLPEMEEAYGTARELGARTVLTGEIAEILFENRAYLADHYLAHGRLGALAGHVSQMRERGWAWRRIASEMAYALVPPSALAAYFDLRPRRPSRIPAWIDIERLWNAEPEVPAWRLGLGRRWPAIQTSVLQGASTHFEASEICAAVCGVDARRPFADVDLWEFVLSLPAEVKFPGPRTKPLLRRAVRGALPDRLIDRKDETYFNEYALDRADYARLKRLLVETPPYLEGIDYGRLRSELEAGEMGVIALQWAEDVARVHAFLEGFEGRGERLVASERPGSSDGAGRGRR